MRDYDTSRNHRGVDTSILAAEDAAGLSNRNRIIVHRALCEHGDQTVEEVCALTGRKRYSLQPRFCELRDMGLIRDTGERRMNESGSLAKVWRAVVLDKLGEAA